MLLYLASLVQQAEGDLNSDNQCFLRATFFLYPPEVYRIPLWELTLVFNVITDSPFEPLMEVFR